jgi:multicomponent Na+:H+ antiporter subunit F
MADEMTWTAQVLDWAMTIAYVLILVSIFMGIVRLVLGPSVADRIAALDFLSLLAIGYIVLTALESGRHTYIDVAIALGLISFLATVALARYLFRRSPKMHRADD